MKISNKNLEFSIKLIILISLIIFLIFDALLQMYDPNKNFYGIPAYERMDIYFSYFTTQSNYIVVCYLVIAILIKQIYNTRLNFGAELAVTVYITLTMIVFWVGIVGSSEQSSTTIPNWISTVILHLIIPIIMIYYFVISCGDIYFSNKKHLKFNFPITCAYPMLYLLFILIRGKLRFRMYSPEFFNNIYSDNNNWIWNNLWTDQNGVIDKSIKYDQQMWYPYWFLNLNRYSLSANGETYSSNLNQPLWLIIFYFSAGIFCVAALVVALQFLYLKINNIKFYNWHDINGNLITKKEHSIRIAKRKQQRKQVLNDLRIMIFTNKTKTMMFKKFISGLPKEEKNILIQKNITLINLEKELLVNYKKKLNQDKIEYKKYVKSLLQNVSYKDRGFIKENLREAERFKKLVKKGIILTRSIND
ncbi:hypothetical protein SCORR_v1c01340 [Spiroplasma corruscae]|uniref:Transmembrane protein n=1 Tax=Spiroplasma corruscae TaxID=216934 RepID=A0A222EN23_9MOLU|nr:Pr6Pr family membrane protein [Spiroplasma corruscae]ASP27909.1 hypothetical protein SCORR_v1c01340 [Spiroplasma corruscae]